MKILHIGPASVYTEGMTYQDNLLPEQNVRDGHDVMFITAARTYKKSIIVTVPLEDTVLKNGVRLVRLPDKNLGVPKLSRLFNILEGLEDTIKNFAPDIILFHGISSFGLLTAAKYKKNNPNVKLYVDSHADDNNSARNLLSRNILHRMIWRTVARMIFPYTEKFLYVGTESGEFLKKYYKLNPKQLEFYPLGGILPLESEYWNTRNKIRERIGLKEQDILFVHSGKLDKLKRTEDILLAFQKCNYDNVKLIIIGDINEDLQDRLLKLIKENRRVLFLGWKSGAELREYLCAADVYVQPGSQSATMQTAMCLRCALMLYPHYSHLVYLKDNGFFVETIGNMVEIFNKFAANRDLTISMGAKSYEFAKCNLDYKVLANRLYR